MLSSNEVITQLKSNGFEIVGSTAVKEQYNVQSIKEAIITENIRPTIPDKIPKFFELVIEKCWSKDPARRLKLDNILEIFREKINETEWSRYDNPHEQEIIPQNASNEEVDDKILAKRIQSNSKPKMMFAEFPISVTVTLISFQDVQLRGKQVMVRLKFRGKSFDTPKKKVPNNTKGSPISLEWNKSNLTKFSFNAMSSSILHLEVLEGSFRFNAVTKTDTFLGCHIGPVSTVEINTLRMTNAKGEQNGFLNMTLEVYKDGEPLNSVNLPSQSNCHM